MKIKVAMLLLVMGASSLATVNCSGFNAAEIAGVSNSSSSTNEDWALAKSTFQRSRCNSCHGTQPGMGNIYLYDPDKLLASGLVVPGDPDSSAVYLNTDGSHQSVPSLTSADRVTIANWILRLAPPTPPAAGTPPPTGTPPPPLTNAQFFVAKTGPNGLSVDDLISNNGRCARCHSSTGSTPDSGAISWVMIRANDPSGNYSRLGAVNMQNGTFRDIRSSAAAGGVNQSLYQYASGHHPKNPAFTATDLTYILNYVKTP